MSPLFRRVTGGVEGRSTHGEQHQPEQHQQETADPSDAIKTYLKSGVHKNDPKKIAEMIRRMKASNKANEANDNRDDAEEDTAAKSIFEKYGGGEKKKKKKKKGTWRPSSKVGNFESRIYSQAGYLLL